MCMCEWNWVCVAYVDNKRRVNTYAKTVDYSVVKCDVQETSCSTFILIYRLKDNLNTCISFISSIEFHILHKVFYDLCRKKDWMKFNAIPKKDYLKFIFVM